MALIAGMAVMMWPSTMKSSIVSASKSGGGRKSTLQRHRRQPVDRDRPAVLLDVPVGLERLALAPPHAEVDDRAAADPALPAGGDAGDVPGRDRPRADVEVLGGLRELGLADDLVELDAERIGHQRDRLAEHRRALRGHLLQVGVVDRRAEARRPLGVGRVVERGVGRLGDGDLVDAVADVGRRRWRAARRTPG